MTASSGPKEVAPTDVASAAGDAPAPSERLAPNSSASQSEPATEGAPKRKVREARFIPSSELEQMARSLLQKATADAALLDETKEPLSVKLGKALFPAFARLCHGGNGRL